MNNTTVKAMMFSSKIFPRLRCATSQRCSHYSQPAANAVVVEKSFLSKLRKQTGFAFSNCRKALVLHDNDYDKALEWLNAEAAKEGWAKANKLQGRSMAQGVIGVIANPTSALLLEINCETDFVARNVQFLELVSEVTNTCYSRLQRENHNKLVLPTDKLGELMMTSTESVSDAIAKQVGTIGENLQARRAIYMSNKGDNSYLAHYIHSAGLNQKYLEVEGCHFGKYCAVVRLTGDTQQGDMALYASNIAQHVVGMNPKAIGSAEDPGVAPVPTPKPSIGETAIESEAAKDATTEDITDTIAQNTTDTSDDSSVEEERTPVAAANETRLLYQEFLLDPELTTGEWLEERELSVAEYVRFEVGEEAS